MGLKSSLIRHIYRQLVEGMGWFALWLAGAVTLAVGFVMLALPSSLEAGQAAAQPTPFTPHLPYALMLAGAAGMVVAVIGIWRSLSRQAMGLEQRKDDGLPRSTVRMTGRATDAAALAGLVSAVAALLAVILASTVLVGPCGGFGAIGGCLSAHPAFYQHDASGFFYSTAAERICLVLALGPGLVSGLALTMGTVHRRAALAGVITGSFPLVAFAALTGLNELRFLGGGFD